jgi:hypothetical protein
MKRFFAMFFSVLLVAFLSSSFVEHKTAFDKDVGYSLTIDQDITVVTPVPAIQPAVSDYQIDRGVSVPYKGLNIETLYLINENQISRMCRIDNYSLIWQRSINTNLETPVKGINIAACDLGTWERYSKINIV